nr:hypothetical protein [Candidatus Saccharibacteria bacterium]NIW78165.1 hypothetical protein [Calditrichia bacterium]
TTFPYFQWYTDVNPAAASYNIFVYERLPTDETTQDVLSHPPILQLMNYQESFFQYPSQSSPTFSSGQAVGPVRLLEEGKTYYWKVESVVPTGTGNLVLESDVYRFKITDLGQGAQSSQQILAFLEQILGPENESFLRQLREQGFEPNGNLSLDGNDVQVNKLLEYLIKVNSGEASIDQVRIY